MEEKVGFFKRLKNGLSKTRDSFVSGIDSLFTGFSEIDDDFYEELEELLVMGDIGINTTMSIIDGLKERVKEEKIKEEQEKTQKAEEKKCTLYAYIIYKLQEITMKKLEEINAVDLFNNIDMPTVTVLANMQWNGMYADLEELNKFGKQLKEQL